MRLCVFAQPSHGEVGGGSELDLSVRFAPESPGPLREELQCDVFFGSGAAAASLLMTGGHLHLPPAEADALPSVDELLSQLASLGPGEVPQTRPSTAAASDSASIVSAGAAAAPPAPDFSASEYMVDLWRPATSPGGSRGNQQTLSEEPLLGPVLQSLRLTVVSEAASAALRFADPEVDFGAVAVNGSMRVPLYIENTSDAALHFSVDAVVQVRKRERESSTYALEGVPLQCSDWLLCLCRVVFPLSVGYGRWRGSNRSRSDAHSPRPPYAITGC
jgi:hypothetical protein